MMWQMRSRRSERAGWLAVKEQACSKGQAGFGFQGNGSADWLEFMHSTLLKNEMESRMQALRAPGYETLDKQ